MNAQDIMNSAEFQRCAAFHGHICPGLSIGFRAAQTAMQRLREDRSVDEEIVAIVETDACAADAVQVLTGCTFGKGNFICKDHGKMALTLISRNSGRGVRVAMQAGAFAPSAEHAALMQKAGSRGATRAERRRFEALHAQRSRDILESPADTLFTITAVEAELPPRAPIEPSQPCPRCGEPTMPAKMELADGLRVCRGCLQGVPHTR